MSSAVAALGAQSPLLERFLEMQHIFSVVLFCCTCCRRREQSFLRNFVDATYFPGFFGYCRVGGKWAFLRFSLQSISSTDSFCCFDNTTRQESFLEFSPDTTTHFPFHVCSNLMNLEEKSRISESTSLKEILVCIPRSCLGKTT